MLQSALDCRSITEFLRKLFAYLQMVFTQPSMSKKIKKFSAYPENIIKVILKRLKTEKTDKD